ncbi:hypothetical protein AgCh_023993 [Apium graveolens]
MVEDLKKDYKKRGSKILNSIVEGKLGDEEIIQLLQKLRDIEKEHSEDELKKENRDKALSELPSEKAAIAEKIQGTSADPVRSFSFLLLISFFESPDPAKMIMGAIDALKEKDGSSKSAIGKHIDWTYGDLPAGHMNSLTEHLNKLKEDEELVFAKNNYMRPGSSAPPKRGRGRPPKVKDANAAEVPVAAVTPPAAPAAVADGPSRGRGRPRKDPNAPPSVKKAKTEKPKEDEKEEDPTPSKSGRARGRPRKTDEESWTTRFSQTFVYMVEDLKKGKLGDEEISQFFQKLRDIEKEHSEDELKKKNREKALSVLPCEQAAVAQKDTELVIC